MGNFVAFDSVSFETSLAFGTHPENRLYNPAHVDQIKSQMVKSFDIIPPITVNRLTYHIIDGQHRHKAYQDLHKSGAIPSDSKLKVMFVDIPLMEEKQAIIDANTNSKNWTIEDYIMSYVRANVISYVRLDEWCKAHPLTSDKGKAKYRYGATMITGRRCSGDLKNGRFTFTEEEFKRADDVHTELFEIVSLFGLKGKGMWIESLAKSWIDVRDQHDFRIWMDELTAKKQHFLKLPKDNSADWDSIFAQAHLAIDKKKK